MEYLQILLMKPLYKNQVFVGKCEKVQDPDNRDSRMLLPYRNIKSLNRSLPTFRRPIKTCPGVRLPPDDVLGADLVLLTAGGKPEQLPGRLLAYRLGKKVKHNLQNLRPLGVSTYIYAGYLIYSKYQKSVIMETIPEAGFNKCHSCSFIQGNSVERIIDLPQ